MKNRILSRLVLSAASTALFFGVAEFAYRAIAPEEIDEKNLHSRFRIYYQDAERETIDAAAASRRGLIRPVPDVELIETAVVLDSAVVGFRQQPGTPPMSTIVAPRSAWTRPDIGSYVWSGPTVIQGERVQVRGSTRNDGFRTAVGFDFVTDPETGEELGVLRVVPPVADEEPGAQVLITTHRARMTWAPSQTFYLCYSGLEQDGQRAGYFDEHGCVPCEINSEGLREREEVIGPKPDGETRVVCIGDSFTFGWGVRVEDAWPRLVEDQLRKTDPGVRTVNCGAAGAIYVDEYASALEHRFGRYQPDAVIVSLCLNDLIPSSNSLAHAEPPPLLLRSSRILRDLLQGYALSASLHIDPDRDLVQDLLDLPDESYPAWATAFPPNSVGRNTLWPGGGPQAGLRRMRDWCAERNIPFGVVIWPYFQGLGSRESYPFRSLHRAVGDFCGNEGISFLDLLPAFEGSVERSSDLWVCIADYHGNEVAQRRAEPQLTAFIGDLLAR